MGAHHGILKDPWIEITKDSMNQYVGDYSNYADFEKVSKAAVQQEMELIALQTTKDSPITSRQDKVVSKYWGKVAERVIRRHRRIRVFVSCLLVAFFVAAIIASIRFQLFPAGAVPWVGIGCIIVAVYFLRPGYANDGMRHFRHVTWEKVSADPEYRTELEKAKVADKQETARNKQRRQNAINQLKKQSSYSWLYKEWEKAAKEIKANAKSYGISDLVESQSIDKIIEILIRKMPSDSLSTTTYSMLIQKAKTKAIADWKKCKIYLGDIDDKLGQMFH